MQNKISLPADGTAERVVRHFQSQGFAGITEALIIRIRLKKGDKEKVHAAFEAAAGTDVTGPMQEYFEIYPYGFYSSLRDFALAKAAFRADFGPSLRQELPSIFFDDAPVVADDALATGTKYDAMVKLTNNADGYALAVLLNDPTSSFFEYLGAHNNYDWQKIMGDFGVVASALGQDLEFR